MASKSLPTEVYCCCVLGAGIVFDVFGLQVGVA